MTKYLQIVDSVMIEAYREGFTIVGDEKMEVYAVRSRLLVYGYVEDGRYHLNELGVRYVMDGCSEGIEKKIAKDSYISDLNIEATKRAMENSDKAIQLSRKSLIVAVVSAVIAFFALVASVYISVR